MSNDTCISCVSETQSGNLLEQDLSFFLWLVHLFLGQFVLLCCIRSVESLLRSNVWDGFFSVL